MALRSQHISLNHHLHCISRAPSPHCPHCPTVSKTVSHFLIDCPWYHHECHTLVCSLGCKDSSLPFLLSDPSATPHLVHFINTTGRLRQTFGEVPLPRKLSD
ncbi:hypothetical protein BDR07DRAFT_1299237 [Suillus spraguei]|nr:hypothetical protein BDR07DRAFT_1299237 [Suillus spraguei]